MCYCRFCHSLFTRFLLRLRLGRGVEGNARVSEQTTSERHTAPSPWHHTYVSTSAGAGASCKPTTSFSPLSAFAPRAASPSLSVRRRSPVVAILQLGAAIPMDGRTAMRRVGPAGGRPGGRPGDRDRPRRVFLRRSHRPQEGKPGGKRKAKSRPPFSLLLWRS